MSTNSTLILPEAEQKLKNSVTLVYLLQALAFFTGITALAGVIIDYIKKDDAKNTWLESHIIWQIRTFWFGLLWTVIGGILCAFVIGILVLFINMLWIIYRIAKGWLRINDNKPVRMDS
jgi:uncharacterized membrane protein